MDTRAKKGQSLLELTVGLFALSLVVSALAGFAIYIVKSLEMQNTLRTGASSQSARLDVSEFAGHYVFGTTALPIHEKVEMPPTTILK